MTKSEKQSWEQERAQGYSRYLLRSLLRAGLPFGVLMTLAHILWPYFRHQPVSPFWQLLVEFGFYVVFFGAWMGVWSWQSKERDYKKPTADDDMV
jgi:peptidoglycan/LPS O-acetylase OafA/YrhL